MNASPAHSGIVTLLLVGSLVGCAPGPLLRPLSPPTAVQFGTVTAEIALPPSMKRRAATDISDSMFQSHWWDQIRSGDKSTGLRVVVDVTPRLVAPKSVEEAAGKSCVRMRQGSVLRKSEEGGGFEYVCHVPTGVSALWFARSVPLADGSRLTCEASLAPLEEASKIPEVLPDLERICRSLRVRP